MCLSAHVMINKSCMRHGRGTATDMIPLTRARSNFINESKAKSFLKVNGDQTFKGLLKLSAR